MTSGQLWICLWLSTYAYAHAYGACLISTASGQLCLHLSLPMTMIMPTVLAMPPNSGQLRLCLWLPSSYAYAYGACLVQAGYAYA